jgi:hypothetical protein
MTQTNTEKDEVEDVVDEEQDVDHEEEDVRDDDTKEIPSDLLSKEYLLINRVSPLDPMTLETRDAPVCLQVGIPYPLFIYCERFVYY